MNVVPCDCSESANLATLVRDRDDLAAILADLWADNDRYDEGWRDALAAAVAACDSRRQEHRNLNLEIRRQPDYDENGPGGDLAHHTAALAESCNIMSHIICALRPPVPNAATTREGELRALLRRAREWITVDLSTPGDQPGRGLLADIDAALAPREGKTP